MSRRPLVFLAVIVVDDKEHPRGVSIANALSRESHNAIVLPNLDEARIVANGSWTIPLVDHDVDGENKWTILDIDTWGTPGWVKKFSTSGWWVAVGKLWVTLPPEAMRILACRMASRFYLEEAQEEKKRERRPTEKTDIKVGRQLPRYGLTQGRF